VPGEYLIHAILVALMSSFCCVLFNHRKKIQSSQLSTRLIAADVFAFSDGTNQFCFSSSIGEWLSERSREMSGGPTGSHAWSPRRWLPRPRHPPHPRRRPLRPCRPPRHPPPLAMEDGSPSRRSWPDECDKELP
jgi:hypothetical protein